MPRKTIFVLKKMMLKLSILNMYLAHYTWPTIAFLVNLLIRYSFTSTWTHWNGVKHVLQYFHGIVLSKMIKYTVSWICRHMLPFWSTQRLIKNNIFVHLWQHCYSWRSVKQIVFVTSSNHYEIISFHEVSCKIIWLRSIIQHIREKCRY